MENNEMNSQNPMQQQAPMPSPEKKKGGRTLMIVVIIAILVVVLLMSKKSEDINDTPTNPSTAQNQDVQGLGSIEDELNTTTIEGISEGL